MAVSLRRATRLFRSIFGGSRVESVERGACRASSSWTSSSWPRSSSFRGRRIFKACLGVLTGGLATCGSVLYFLDRSVKATGLEAKPPQYPWSMEGVLSSLDHEGIRRGWHVFRTVCSTCHSLRYFCFMDLVDVAFTAEEMKTIAAEYEVEDGPDDEGNYYKRPCKLNDRLPPPFPNDEAARAANNGALPVDLSFIINARKSGKNYLFSLLTGYCDPPAGVELAEGQVFNAYFPGGAISMPEKMSWFFGKKKHHRESPPDTPEEAAPGQSDDYIIIEKEENPLSPNSERTGGLYPSLGNGAAGLPPFPSATPQQQLPTGDSQNYLLGIPFKLSKSFDNDFEIDGLRVDEIMSFVLSVQNETYDYDFGLERSVINEMESGAE